MKQDWNTRLISEFHLERYHLGELPDAEAISFEARLAADPSLRQRLDALRAHDRVFAAHFAAEKIVPEIEAAQGRAGPYRRRPVPLSKTGFAQRLSEVFQLPRGLQVAGALVLLVLTLLPVYILSNRAEPEGLRLKGKVAELRLYRNTPDGPE
ncbi:MAG: hypothetical protein M3Y08_15385, partial [Fibrobacterota bacterium]|nr:hypothetical protein [Fibrobacterota bacterium]